MYRVLVFAGPNGSGKSTVAAAFPITGAYVNADDLKKLKNCSDLDAVLEAENICYELIDRGQDFTFETVLSSPYKLKLLEHAKNKGYRIMAIYVTTNDPEINVKRVRWRVEHGGHPVPDDTVRTRYYKSLLNLPKLIELADRTLIYDNTGDSPELICEANDDGVRICETLNWSEAQILELLAH